MRATASLCITSLGFHLCISKWTRHQIWQHYHTRLIADVCFIAHTWLDCPVPLHALARMCGYAQTYSSLRRHSTSYNWIIVAFGVRIFKSWKHASLAPMFVCIWCISKTHNWWSRIPTGRTHTDVCLHVILTKTNVSVQQIAKHLSIHSSLCISKFTRDIGAPMHKSFYIF